MKRASVFVLTIIILSVVTACAGEGVPSETVGVTTSEAETTTCATESAAIESTAAVSTSAVPTAETTLVQPETESTTISEPATEIYESQKFHVDSVSVEDMIIYYNEVVLDSEFSTGTGDSSLVQKWGTPIMFMLHGDYTEEDYVVLSGFVDYLNSIEGFPGMFEVYDQYESNLDIFFCDTADELVEKMGGSDDFINLDGAVTFWYDNNSIYDGIICYRNDIEQEVKNSVIIEEIYNGLGPVQDTDLRTDSIIYSGYTFPQEITEVDDVILRLLYNADILCGMNAEECESVIRNLYY